MTYRFRGHSMGDPERYRKPEEVHKWQENDPIGIYRTPPAGRQDRHAGGAGRSWMHWSRQRSRKPCGSPKNSPEPAPEALFEHIYADSSNQLID